MMLCILSVIREIEFFIKTYQYKPLGLSLLYGRIWDKVFSFDNHSHLVAKSQSHTFLFAYYSQVLMRIIRVYLSTYEYNSWFVRNSSSVRNMSSVSLTIMIIIRICQWFASNRGDTHRGFVCVCVYTS